LFVSGGQKCGDLGGEWKNGRKKFGQKVEKTKMENIFELSSCKSKIPMVKSIYRTKNAGNFCGKRQFSVKKIFSQRVQQRIPLHHILQKYGYQMKK